MIITIAVDVITASWNSQLNKKWPKQQKHLQIEKEWVLKERNWRDVDRNWTQGVPYKKEQKWFWKTDRDIDVRTV